VKRGDIFWAELAPRSGSEQQGRRPVVVVSHDGYNQAPGWRSIIVVPLSTSEAQSKRGPTAPVFPKGVAGLKQTSVALCHQVTTLDRSKLTKQIGTLYAKELRMIDQGLKAALSLN